MHMATRWQQHDNFPHIRTTKKNMFDLMLPVKAAKMSYFKSKL